jgi:hypothetical protein
VQEHLESEAREARKGLWVNPAHVPPWGWSASSGGSGRSGRGEMVELGRPKPAQQLITAELDEVSIVRREPASGGQQGVNGFAGAYEIPRTKFVVSLQILIMAGLLTKRKTRNEGRISKSDRASQEKKSDMLSKEFLHERRAERWHEVRTMTSGATGVLEPPYRRLDMGKRRSRRISRRTTEESSQTSRRSAPEGHDEHLFIEVNLWVL